MRSLTTSLASWEPREAVERKDALSGILDSPGLEAIYAAIEARKADLTSQLLTRSPSDNAAEYAQEIGRLKSYEEFPLLIAGILEHGRSAELVLREQTE